MAIIVIDLSGDETVVISGIVDESKPEKKPDPSDLERYVPLLEIVPVEPSLPRRPIPFPF